MNGLSEKQWILISHVGTLIGYAVPFGHVIVPLVIYSMKKEAPTVREHSRRSLNFQLSITLYLFIAFALMLVFVGFLLIGAVALLQLVCVIIATIKADKDEPYHYPLTIEFVKA